MNEPKKSTILLAIDPFEKRMRPSRIALRELHFWARKLGARVDAVYVMPESPSDSRFNQLHTRAYDQLKEAVASLHLDMPVHTRVIWGHEDEPFQPADILVDYAKEIGANLILVSSHGRKWFSKMVLGSFAEKVLMHSPVPVLFFGMLPNSSESFRRVMFTTDFSDASKLAFEMFLDQIRPMNPELLIFHVAEYPNLISGMSLSGVGAYLPETYWRVMKESLINEGDAWAKIAREHGVSQVRTVIEEGIGDVASSIKKTALAERISLIGLASIRSEFQKVVMGSISTQVFRSHSHSVWVCGPTVFSRATLARGLGHQRTRELR
jgi:nucleotide-binding universal stress UspA family protein